MKLHAGDLYWDKTERKIDYPVLAGNLQTEVLIVGGGMSGAMVSYQLVQSGLEVTVIDERVPGFGSSDGNTGIIQYCSDMSLAEMIKEHGEAWAVDFYGLSLKAMKELDDIAAHLKGSTGYRRIHSLFLTPKEKGVEDLKRNQAALEEHGFPSEEISGERLEKEWGIKAAYALRTSCDAMLNPEKMLHEIHEYNEEKGAVIYQNTKMEGYERTENGWIVRANGHKIQCQHLVLAMGYAQDAYPAIESLAKRGTTFSFVTEPIEQPVWKDEDMIWDDEDPYLYFRMTEDHRLIAGGRDREGIDLVSEDEIHKEGEKIYKSVKSYYPELEAPLVYCWQSVFGESKDGLPFIGEDEESKGLYYAFGFGGNGTCYSVIAGLLLRDAILGIDNPLAYTVAVPRRK